MKNLPIYLFFLLVIVFFGCGGTAGAPGQPGGPNGQPGAAGQDGRSGPINISPRRKDPPKQDRPNELPLGTDGTYDDADLTGPSEPPTYYPTVYRPYLRRSETLAPALPPAKNSCHLAAEVINYDGIDGCGLLLETDAGNLFYVGASIRGEPLEAGTRISFGYEYMENMENNCQNADATIRITCKRLLRVSSGIARPIECEAYDKASKWLHDLATGIGATYITRFPWKEERFVYLIESPEGQYLYDCRGYLLCKPRKNCLGFIEDYSGGEVIWEG